MRLKFCSITMGIPFISIRREEISGIPSSWPGADLDIGSSGQKVKQIQEQLNLIGEFYNAIPVLVADGIYGERTAEAVKGLPADFLICRRPALWIFRHGIKFPTSMCAFRALQS